MAAGSKGGQVFVSCGQFTAQERKLGEQVCALVRELTPHDPYFAQQQNSLAGFTKNILEALDNAVALIAIMHPRGLVSVPDNGQHIRASVWIEQEIAVAAYITQVIGRQITIAPYIHAGISREGMREQLQLNAVTFTEDSEVLEHLREILPAWNGLPASLKSTGPPKVRVVLEQGRSSHYLFRFTNDSDEEVFINEIILEHNGVKLTDPMTPDSPRLWKVGPHLSMSFAKTITHQKDPATGLVYIYPNEGLSFNKHMDIVFECETKRNTYLIRERIYVQVNVTKLEILSLV